MSLFARVILILLLALLPTVGIQIYNDQALLHATEREVRSEALREARDLNAAMDRLLTGVRNALVALSGYPAIQAPEPTACAEVLRRFLGRVGLQGTLNFLGSDGRVLCSGVDLRQPTNNGADRPHFRLPVERRDFAVGGYFVGRTTGTQQLGMGYPVYGNDGALRGVLMVGLELSWLRSQILAKGLPPGYSVTIADRQGRLLLRLPEERMTGQLMSDEFRWMLTTSSEGVAETVSRDGVHRIVAYVPLIMPTRDVFVSVGFSTELAYAASRAASHRAYTLTAIGFALAVLVSAVAARRSITRPVGAMLRVAEQWRTGARDITVPVPRGGGEIARIAGALNEMIAAASQTEAALRRHLAEISALFESAPVGLGLLDRDLRYVALNARLSEINGRSIADHLGRTVAEVLPDLAPRLETLLHEILRSGQGRHRVEFYGPTPGSTGADRSWLVGWQPVCDDDGRVSSIAFAVQETTALRATQAALQDSEARFALAQDAIGLGTFDWNVVTDELRWSPQQYRLHFLSPEPGGPGASYPRWVAAILPEDRARAQVAQGAAREGRTLYSTEYRVMNPATGEPRWIATLARIFPDAKGRPLRVVGVNYDVTERHAAQEALAEANARLERRVAERTAQLEAEIGDRRRIEADLLQAQKMEALGQLTGGVAHDFNNLLTAVIGNLELALRRSAGNAELRRLLEGGLRAANRGAALTQRMLAFARRQILLPQPVDLAALVGGMENLLARTIGPGIRVTTDVPVGLWRACADPTQLELAVLNLAINARDAMPDGGALTISAANETLLAQPGALGPAEPGDYVRIAVADTGAGMDAATMARVFEPFFTTKAIGKGSGLGLPMVHTLARELGGGMQLKSDVGIGTTVVFWLPRAGVEDAGKPREPPRAGTPARLRGAVVLLVDDDADVASFAAACLEDAGLTVLQATDGEAALTLLQRTSRVDALVVDFAMPSMTGTCLTQRARILRPGLPALLVTGYADLDLPQRGLGGLPVLQKPYRGEQLLAAIATLLETG